MTHPIPLLQHRFFLYGTEFFAGMAVMAVELGAARLLAPYFSSSQIVWTIIIGTIMIAMASGNYLGGKWADAHPNPAYLYRNILIAALWIAAIPVVGKYVIAAITGILIVTISTNLLIVAAFLACMLLFVFPLFLLGTVTPSLAKYTVRSLDDSGTIVGTLGACNTIGSILGTFLPTFLTIPAVGTAISFLLFSGMLVVISLIYFVATKQMKPWLIVLTLLFIVFSVIGHSQSFAFSQKNIRYEGESLYNYLQVQDTPKSTILSTNVMFGVQSIKMKEQTLTGMYYDYALLGPVLAETTTKDKPSMLILGMGAGTYASQCRQYFPNLAIEGVEIDQKITDLSYAYFDAPRDVPVTTYDGRAYLYGTDKKYDVIMVDAYQDITIPFQMSSVEFFRLVQSHLKDGGVMVVNMNMETREAGNINDYLQDTIATVFPHVYTVDVRGASNRELFATSDAGHIEKLKPTIGALPNSSLRSFLTDASTKVQPYAKGNHVLTDDKAPVELLGMKTIDALIQDEIKPYRKRFEEQGFEGLIE